MNQTNDRLKNVKNGPGIEEKRRYEKRREEKKVREPREERGERKERR
jgi:hypothetical protein